MTVSATRSISCQRSRNILNVILSVPHTAWVDGFTEPRQKNFPS
ncbi:MAG: hypothetical protein QOI29_261 [Mycobacterium sp.]|jgi:hypothetical protein|nr:hypothetical protein [Mycobacterium sp.]